MGVLAFAGSPFALLLFSVQNLSYDLQDVLSAVGPEEKRIAKMLGHSIWIYALNILSILLNILLHAIACIYRSNHNTIYKIQVLSNMPLTSGVSIPNTMYDGETIYICIYTPPVLGGWTKIKKWMGVYHFLVYMQTPAKYNSL